MRVGFFTVRMLLGYGVDLVVAELARRLVRDGHEVTVFTTIFDDTFAGESFGIEKVEIPGGECNRALFIYERNTGRVLRRMRERLSEFDVLVPATFPFYCVHRHFGGPVLHFDFGNVPTRGFSFWGKLNWTYLHLVETYWHTLRADAVATISRFLASRFLPEARRKLTVLHLGGDHYLNDMNARGNDVVGLRRAMRARLGIYDDEVVIACCTRLHRRHAPYKNLPELVATFRRLREVGLPVRLMLAGLGSPDDEAWLRGEGADVLANLPAGEMPAFYAAADIYASPSLWEGFNLPLVEAAWFGVPAIAYDVAAHPETTASILVSSAAAFREQLGRLVFSAESRKKLGEVSRVRAQRFSWEIAYRKFAQLLEGLVNP